MGEGWGVSIHETKFFFTGFAYKRILKHLSWEKMAMERGG